MIETLCNLTDDQIKKADRTLSVGTWTITAGAILFSVLTVTPLVERVTPEDWQWTAPILPLVVDAAVVIVVRLEAVLSRLGAKGGVWPGILRWMTGLMTLGLNTADSWLKGDKVGVAVHAVAPVLLIMTAEAARGYRRAITEALDRRAHEQAEAEERRRVHEQSERERERAEREAREQREREEREREQERRERAEREERERADRLAREQREHEAEQARQAREHEAALRREDAEREERRLERERQERDDARRREEDERRRKEQEAEQRRLHERQEQERKRREREQEAARRRAPEQPSRTVQDRPVPAVREHPAAVAKPAAPKAAVNTEKMTEAAAREVVMNTPGASVRQLAETTGWSIGWVSNVRRELTSSAA
jgi:hypothetical protein